LLSKPFVLGCGLCTTPLGCLVKEGIIMKNLIVILFLLSNQSFSQDHLSNSFWGQVGTGINFMKLQNTNSGFNLSASFNYEVNNNNFSISFLHSSEFSLFTHPEEYIKSIELKYGRSIDFSMRGLIFPFPFLLIIKRKFDYSLIGKIGISYNESRERTLLLEDDFFDNRYNSKNKYGLGLPIEIELREEITNFLGMGVSLYTNFNEVKNYSGFNFSLYVGQF